ncbi:MAG: NB-ARC domain-containing protein [Actinomycetota bacterium]|nr:AAA family ATPase [Acidimicrobiia bacterium]MDQ3183680.1 NB-ARC domain-containing protein [Actinomycetota bacterium]
MSDATHPPREARGSDRGRLVAVSGGHQVASLTNNLPLELSSFVGREKELAEVKRLLEDTRLLTLTGSGGCGKTRLALAAASELVERFVDGVWLVTLAPLADPSLVSQAVASVLDAREQPGCSLTETLSNYLRYKKMLLVLDNCEHLIEACAGLAETLLCSCPELRILSTSRKALGITGEIAGSFPLSLFPTLGVCRPSRACLSTRRLASSSSARRRSSQTSHLPSKTRRMWPRAATGWTASLWLLSWRRQGRRYCR